MVPDVGLEQADVEGVGTHALPDSGVGRLQGFHVLRKEHVQQVVLVLAVVADDARLVEDGFVAFRAGHFVLVVIILENDVVGELGHDAVALLLHFQRAYDGLLFAHVHEYALKHGNAVLVAHEARLKIYPDDASVSVQDAVFDVYRDVRHQAGAERVEQPPPVVRMHDEQGLVRHVLGIFRMAPARERVETGVGPDDVQSVREREARHAAPDAVDDRLQFPRRLGRPCTRFLGFPRAGLREVETALELEDHAVEGAAQLAELVRTPDVEGPVEIARRHLLGESHALPEHAGDIAEDEEDEQTHEQQRPQTAQEDFAAQVVDVGEHGLL